MPALALAAKSGAAASAFPYKAVRRSVAARAAVLDRPAAERGAPAPAPPAAPQPLVPQPQRPTIANPARPAVFTAHNAQLFSGRLAMMGFVAGAIGELFTHQPLLSQFAAAEPRALAAAALVAAASVVPLLNGAAEGDEVFGPMTPKAENLNGNAALVGLGLLLAIEALKGSALL
ncbi:hypothetical protein Rsub_08070 [Raphidocelis subcapitata]|uniref:Uncharacterized protein n=1 Tax=Raphidocelis subcapitata TaxID=307507 RepID=A0A2V0PFG7_9CHLO|nr:hypothetical protein Rsub_08070 [Raphidocelis subcapitata]|eukprot:GBF95947.1 hypothetical protein Rsub_08070 [Raphidocelis subcapitata]